MEPFTGRLLDLDSCFVCDVEGNCASHGGLYPYVSGVFQPVGHGAKDVIRGWDYVLDIHGGPLLIIVTSNVKKATDPPSAVRFSSQGEPLKRS